MRYFAIRRKSDGAFLPAGRGRGFTHDQPVLPESKPPRLFTQKHHAAAALRCWLQGDWKEHTRYDPFGEAADIYPEPPSTPSEDRHAEDMEVVDVELAWSEGRSICL